MILQKNKESVVVIIILGSHELITQKQVENVKMPGR
jgi:hypothetical protein